MAEEDGELSFEAGEEVIATNWDDAWWTGHCNGRYGVFPSSFVQLREEEPSQRAQPQGRGEQAIPSNSTARLDEDVNRTFAGTLAPDVNLLRESRQCRALFSYDATNGEELSFTEGNEVIATLCDEAWWYGHSNGRYGYFPSNYVEAVGAP